MTASTSNGEASTSATSASASTPALNGESGAEEAEEMSQYKKNVLNVVKFKIAYEPDDLYSETAPSFKPQMAHQMFGESESIFGYRSLSINLNYLHNSFHCYVDVQSGRRIERDNITPDDIIKLLNPWLPGNYTVSYDEFQQSARKEVHDRVFGDLVEKFQDQKPLQQFPEENIVPTFQITKIDEVYLKKEFREFHERFETFIVWFIDAANFIDLDDNKWLIYYVYEKFTHPKTKKTYITPIGFCSVYKFYSYPDLIRPRLSQFFILPTHQKRGIGTRLYKTVVRDLRSMDKAMDITVEEPTVEFKKIRDLDDCLIIQNEIDISHFFQIPIKDILKIGKAKKISKMQTMRVYDILGSAYSQRISKAAYQKFMESIKNRLVDDTQKEQRPGKRFCNLQREVVTLNLDQKAQIEAEFNRRIEEIEPSLHYFQKNCQRQ